MDSRPILFLIKDFIDQRIVFYWENTDGKPVSPTLVNLKQAEEWWLNFNFALYEHQDRRKSIHDRRRLHEQRAAKHRSRQIHSSSPNGRRFTDVDVQVHTDRSRSRLLQFYATNPQLFDNGACQSL